MVRVSFDVTGMACDGCEDAVENALNNLENVTEVIADHERDSVEIVSSAEVDKKIIQDTIESAGYEVTG